MNMIWSIYSGCWAWSNTACRAEVVERRGSAKARYRLVPLICFIAFVAMGAALPANAQSQQDLLKINDDLVKQNKELMEQNRRLMEMVQKNAARIEKLESTVTTSAGGAATGAAAATPPLEERVKQLETKTAALDKGPVVTSGSKNVRLNISGQINRGVLFSDDGNSTDVFHVDNDNSSTRVRFVGEADLGKWTAGTVLEAEFESNSTGDINQENQSTSASLKERKIEFFIEQPSYGKLTVGQGSTASDGTAEVDLSGTGVVGYSSISDMAGGLLLFDKSTGALSSTRIKDVSSNFDGLSRDDRLRYDTPKFYGISLAASHVSNDKWDLAIFQSGTFGDFDVAGAAGYADPNDNRDYRLSASYSVRHSSGFNVTVAGGQDDLESGDNDPWSAYAKLGYIIDWKKHDVASMARIGNTNLAVDYHRTEDLAQDGDEFQSIGGFIVQNVDAWAADLYLGFRWHDLDRDDANFDDVFATLAGGRFRF